MKTAADASLSSRMPSRATLALALLLATFSVGACGSEDPELIPQSRASELSATVDEIVVYETVEAPVTSGPLLAAAVNAPLQAVIFASPSAGPGPLRVAEPVHLQRSTAPSPPALGLVPRARATRTWPDNGQSRVTPDPAGRAPPAWVSWSGRFS